MNTIWRTKMIIKPAFENNNIPIVFSVDENYAIYLTVCLKSLIANCSLKNNYDIWILDGGISENNKNNILNLINGTNNISIRFFDILNFKQIKKTKFFLSNHASLANYYRLFIPKIFFNYTKLLYLDCDLIINRDLADLISIDIGNKTLGVVRDACTYFDPIFWYKYCLEKVKIKKPFNYFNSGVLICNVQKMIQISLTQRSLKQLKKFNPVCWDQCILNSLLETDVFFLPSTWNFQWHWLLPEFKNKYFLQNVEYTYLNEYLQASHRPYILHYTSHIKPWKRWNAPLAKNWWIYAKQLPTYEKILKKNGREIPLKKSYKEEINIMKGQTSMSEIKMSIIIPVYNVSKYLVRCLDSVINQTLKEIEIICIDDGSTDGCKEILEQYAQKDKRIICIEQKNQGQGSARNNGLKIAKGKYIQFLDSDDFYEPMCCEKMYNLMEKEQVDVACFEPKVIYEAYSFRKKEDATYFSLKYAGLKKITPEMARLIDVNCWNKTFKKDFLEKNKITFPERLHFEDVAFFWFWITKVDIVYFFKEQLINYVRHQNSFVGNIFDKKTANVFDAIKVNDIIFSYLENNKLFSKYGNEFIKYCIFKLQWQISYIPNANLEIKKELINQTSILLKKVKYEELTLSDKEKILYQAITNKKYSSLNCGDTSDVLDVKPAFENRNIPIIFAVDKNYVPYLSVAIQSIVTNSSDFENYDIIILYTDLYEFQKRMLISIGKDTKNVSIRFINMDSYVKEYNLSSLMHINHITLSAYFRLLSSTIFAHYQKIIYLDCDVIINEDIANLYKIDIEDKSIGACLDTVISNNLDSVLIHQGLKEYLQNVLDIPSEKKYFNSGVLIININKWKKQHIQSYLLQLARINNRFFHDQNVLNSAFYNDCYILPPKWNLQYHVKFKWPNYKMHLSEELLYLYDNISAKPSIIHYTSAEKPWKELLHTYTSNWWQYARKSPFYEIILKEITSEKSQQNTSIPNVNQSTILHALTYKKDRIRYWRYKLLSKITFGKMRKHYKYKKKELKKQLKEFRNFLKTNK